MAALAEAPFDNWIAEAAVVGLWDVLRHYGYFRRKFHAMREAILKMRPDAVVYVDYPGFNLRMAKALRAEGFGGKNLYYISPQVWAWHRGRIPKMAKFLDLMLCVFPFEQAMYEASGLHTLFTGHPLLEALAEERIAEGRDGNLLGIFPGSRWREVKRNFPAMLEAGRLVRERRAGTVIAAAAASEEQAGWMRELAGDFPITIETGTAHRLMQRASAGLVCSGTATLEAAYFGLPYALVYKVAWLTFEVGKRLVDVPMLGIINILNNYRKNPPPDPRQPAKPAAPVVKELIQHLATPEAMAEEALRLLNDEEARERLAGELRELVSALEAEGASERAARAVLENL